MNSNEYIQAFRDKHPIYDQVATPLLDAMLKFAFEDGQTEGIKSLAEIMDRNLKEAFPARPSVADLDWADQHGHRR